MEENRFTRTEALLGSQALKKLSQSKVIIFGLGGVGGYAVEALARSGIGSIDIVDCDRVTITNINRQIYALSSTLGQYKTEVCKKRILDINPNINVRDFNLFFDENTADLFDFSKYDYIIDAIDSIKSKIELVLKAQEKNIPIISSMGMANKTNPLMIDIADIYKTSVCPLARILRHELKKRGVKKLKVVYSKEIPIGHDKKVLASSSYVPPCAGLVLASEVIKFLIK